MFGLYKEIVGLSLFQKVVPNVPVWSFEDREVRVIIVGAKTPYAQCYRISGIYNKYEYFMSFMTLFIFSKPTKSQISQVWNEKPDKLPIISKKSGLFGNCSLVVSKLSSVS